MKYNLSTAVEVERAQTYFNHLRDKKALVEIKKVSLKRSLRQNAYIHVTFGIFSLQTGYTIQESKVIYKREANPEIYVYERKGQKFLRSSADLSKAEMAASIDKWRQYAGEQGILIPEPGEEEKLRYWQNEIEMQGKYL